VLAHISRRAALIRGRDAVLLAEKIDGGIPTLKTQTGWPNFCLGPVTTTLDVHFAYQLPPARNSLTINKLEFALDQRSCNNLRMFGKLLPLP